MTQLENKKLSPYRSLDKNEDIGDMHMIRTHKSLRGTRYFHAQFFSDQHKDSLFVQHISFEVKAG